MVRVPSPRVYAPAALAGALYFLSFPPFGIWPLAWLALAPLSVAVRRATTLRQATLAGALAALVACGGGYFWIAGMAHRFWSVPWAAAAALLALFGTFGEIGFTVFAALAWVLRRRLAAAPAAATAGLFVLCEAVMPRIFPDALGNSVVNVPALPFSAALVGVHGLSFLLAWVGSGLGCMLEPGPLSLRRRRVELGLCGLAIVAVAAYGGWRSSSLEREPPRRRLDVAIVQANIGDPEELADSLHSVTRAVDSVLTAYIGQTRQALRGHPADLVVWPETAYPGLPREPVQLRLRRLTEEIGSPLCFGAYDFEPRDGKRWRVFNAAYWMPRTGELAARYYKTHLLLFGEYVPLSDRFPVLLRILPSPGEFSGGRGPRPFRMGDVTLAPLICYELLFPRYVRQCLRAGGDVLVNLTNDYWFGPHGEPEQHLALSRMRAFENGRPIVRATNTGISALIDARGQIVARTGVWEKTVLRGTLPIPFTHWTPYGRWGEWTTALLVVLATGLVALVWKRWP